MKTLGALQVCWFGHSQAQLLSGLETFPSGQVTAHLHCPLTQVVLPVQALPQESQFCASVAVSTQDPLQYVSPSGQGQLQFSSGVDPSGQLCGHTQSPRSQICPPLQNLPQRPQLFGSVCVSTHRSSQQRAVPVHLD